MDKQHKAKLAVMLAYAAIGESLLPGNTMVLECEPRVLPPFKSNNTKRFSPYGKKLRRKAISRKK